MTESKARRIKAEPPRPFVFLHVGDLHLAHLAAGAPSALQSREARLESDLDAILKDIDAIQPNGGFDFVYLPGDLAENACAAEYDTLLGILGKHPHIPVCLIPGDHDRAQGRMTEFAAFRAALTGVQQQKAPKRKQCVEAPLDACPPSEFLLYDHIEQYFFELSCRGVLCLFLDLVSAGGGQKGRGLDFRLGKGQFHWLKDKVKAAKRAGTPCAVFMHCYPADMHEPDDIADVAGLFWDGGVRLVEMGHTHYNEIAHDGRTQYATARSVGQNEDGPTGYAVVALDGDATSWRFKQLQQTWPFVMITSPADRRLATGPLQVDARGEITVRALILSDQDPYWGTDTPLPHPDCEPDDNYVQDATVRYRAWCSVDGGEYYRMKYIGNSMYELRGVKWREGSTTISVNVTDGRWQSRLQDFIDSDAIEPAERETVDKSGAKKTAFVYRTKPDRPGSGAFHVGAWPKKGIRGDQLGPNSGGRKW